MRLILTNSYMDWETRKHLLKVNNLEGGLFYFLEGDSFKNIKDELYNVIDSNIKFNVVTSDERLLMCYPQMFDIDTIYLYQNGKLKLIKDCTTKELRHAHNLFKMYIAGAFDINLNKEEIN